MKASEMIEFIKNFANDNPRPSDIEEVIYMNSKTLAKLNIPLESVSGMQIDIGGIPIKINDLIQDDMVYKTKLCCHWKPDDLKDILPSIRPQIYPYTNYKQSD